MQLPTVVHLQPYDINIVYDKCTCGSYSHLSNYGTELKVHDDVSDLMKAFSIICGVIWTISGRYLLKIGGEYVIGRELCAILRDNPRLLNFEVPSYVRMHGVDYIISMVADLQNDWEAVISHNDFTIEILKDMNGAKKYAALWHEIFHHIRVLLGDQKDEKDVEEQIVQVLSYQFVAFLQLNDVRFILCND